MSLVSDTKQEERAQSTTRNPREILRARYAAVRRITAALCAPLALDDYGLQAMPEVSPPKWHLAHTTWFFETFLLKPFLRNYRPFDPQYEYLFNSYYNGVGPQYPRPQRGLLSRPTLDEVLRYRGQVDEAMTTLFDSAPESAWPDITARTTLGCHHEEQHQELLLTDVKYSLGVNPLRPAYRSDLPPAAGAAPAQTWLRYPGGIRDIGCVGSDFCFDNETPHHRVLLRDYSLASRLVTCGEYLEFIEAGGYDDPSNWLADGWNAVRERGWRAPLYWETIGGRRWLYTLGGLRPLNESEPVCHVSYYEADAYARWAGRRLPTEAEWEVAAQSLPVSGNLREVGELHPVPAASAAESQLFGDAWEWTASAYAPYPGYRPLPGAIGEYNGKFMANQMVLRGGSCVTPTDHIRASYRNFFYPHDRWQFSGIRLADDR
jgi:ergothioneine biosynthesis protein EgtB